MKANIKKSLVAFALFMPVGVIYAASGTELMTVEDTYLLHAERASLEELDEATGREGIDVTAVNNMNVRALLSGNTATNNASGFNMIDNGSFAGSGGMFSVIQNSGNNVLIQDSTVINVTILP